jgi:UDP-N-acetylmuramoyl-L-alanyl-D-glutamate--2,6-diaminopimelate ligase
VASQEKNLKQLIQEISVINLPGSENPLVKGIKIDSREVESGDLFVALPGTRVDGHQFIPQAIQSGASALVGTQPAEQYSDVDLPYLQVKDSRQTLAELAASWYDYPARKLIVIGVTGTDGKTTTVNLIYQILLSAGKKAGLISTVNAVIGDRVLDTGFHVTTPEAIDVQSYLAEMVQEEITHVVLEATSHGLAQKRVAACEFDLGVVTNITHEHLDFHGDYQAYLNAKAELIRLLRSSPQKPGEYYKVAVLNYDDQSFSQLERIVSETGVPLTTYGIENLADYTGKKVRSNSEGIQFWAEGPAGKTEIRSSLVGDYNAANCLAASAACIEGLDLNWKQVVDGIGNLESIPGRMEVIDLGQEFTAMVDFAHTPNALKKALSSARNMTEGQVIAVFGSAGLRDREKRRLMAEVSAEMADLSVFTAEDPRTESLESILEEMGAGAISRGGKEGRSFWKIEDRGDAIRFALDLAQSDDLVLVCGKGHEQSMCFGEVEYPWDDRIALQAALAEYLGLVGPDMPYLPTRDL